VSDRISSGEPRLDEVLGGGLPANAINLIMGLPGSGKTILAQQYLFANATQRLPGLYLTTVSEPLEKVLRYGQTLEFFDAQAVGSRVFYEALGPSLAEQAPLDSVLDRIVELLRERNPGMIVIDSFKALHPYARDPEDFRRFLHDLSGRLSAYPATSLWIGEYTWEDIGRAPEFAVVDAVVALTVEQKAEREARVIQVLKLRGSAFRSGKHAYRLSSRGLEAFPRLADPVEDSDYGQEGERISSGVTLLDEALGSGLWPGASTLVAGPSGSGKTLIGLHFIFEGAKAGEPGLIAGFQENSTQLERIAQGFGWSLTNEGAHHMYRSTVDMYVDEWVYDLLDQIEQHQIKRVLIDSLGDLRAASLDEVRFKEYIYSLLQRTARSGVSLLMTQEVAELFGVTKLSEYGISHLSDNVILLQFLRGESRIKRALTVLKTRASAHDPRIMEFEISEKGVALGTEFGDDQSWE
jgi:circadian clock protein KaiC